MAQMQIIGKEIVDNKLPDNEVFACAKKTKRGGNTDSEGSAASP